MPVIKADHTPKLTREAVVLDLGDLGQQAARLRMAAEQKASTVVAKAEQQAAELIRGAEAKGLEQGRAAGHEQGRAEGREAGRIEALEQTKDQLQQLQTAWSDVIKQWDEQSRRMVREARQDVLAFALKFAEKLVHRVIEVDSSVIVDQLGSALGCVLQPLEVSVKINPGDRPVLEQALPELLAEFDQIEHVQLVDDAEVSRGGCVVAYGQGQIDATIENQMHRIVDLILPATDRADSSEPP